MIRILTKTALLITFVHFSIAAQTVSVTFKVDMREQARKGNFNPATEKVTIPGTFNDWFHQPPVNSGKTMEDPDGDSIYTKTIALKTGETYEYKYNIGLGWDGKDEFYGKDNRLFTAPANDIELNVVWYNNETLSLDTAVSSVEKMINFMTKYLRSQNSGINIFADDVIFTNMATGEEFIGQQEVIKMLNYLFKTAFDADAEMKGEIYSEGKAVFEGTFKGKHIGEFAGIPATNKNVTLPICVVYDLENNKIKRGRIYFDMHALIEHLKEL